MCKPERYEIRATPLWALAAALWLFAAAPSAVFGQNQPPPPEAPAPEVPAPQAPAAPTPPPLPEAPEPGAGPDVVETPAEVTLPEEAPEPARKVRVGEKVVFGGSLSVDADEIAREVVLIGGTVDIRGEVEHEVVVVGGSAFIDGEVGRDVTVVGGNLSLGPGARLGRDVQLIGSTLSRDPEAVIEGTVNEVGLFGPGFDPGALGGALSDLDIDVEPRRSRGWGVWRYLGGVVSSLLWLAGAVLLLCLAVLVAGRLVERTDRKLGEDLWKALGVGFLFQVLFICLMPMVILFLVITIIGIPLLVLLPFLLIALWALTLVGAAAVALRVGRAAAVRFGWSLPSPYAAVAVGTVAFLGWFVVAQVLDVSFLSFLVVLICLFAWLAVYAALTAGFGALLLLWLDRRRGEAPAAVAPAPQPPALPEDAAWEPAPEPAAEASWEPAPEEEAAAKEEEPPPEEERE